MRRPRRDVDEDGLALAPTYVEEEVDKSGPDRTWLYLVLLGVCIFYFAWQSEPPWPDAVGGPARPRTLASNPAPALRVSEAVNKYVSNIIGVEDACTEAMWLKTLSQKCGASMDPKALEGTCCAFKTPFPEVALLTGARKKVLNVPGEATRKAVAAKPLWGFRHDPGADVVMGLGFYPTVAAFQYFVGSLRKTGFRGDVVMVCERRPCATAWREGIVADACSTAGRGPGALDDVRAQAVGPRKKIKRRVEEYLQDQRVVAYPFEYTCHQKGMSRRRLLATPGGCVLDDWYVAGDGRGPRPLALARYEMYETWLRQYSSTSYALVLDTRDTFFQRDP